MLQVFAVIITTVAATVGVGVLHLLALAAGSQQDAPLLFLLALCALLGMLIGWAAAFETQVRRAIKS